MKIKLLEFFSNESELSKLPVIYLTIVSGITGGLLVLVINNAAEIVFRDIEAEFPYLVIFIVICVILVSCKKRAIKRSVIITEELVRKMRVRMMNKIRNTELVFLEQNGHSEIYVRLTQDINTVSQAIPVLIIALDSFFTIIGVFIYCAFLSIQSFICIVFFIGISIIFFFSKYFESKSKYVVADAKESLFFETLNGLMTGFKQIKVNRLKNDMLYEDISSQASQCDELKGRGLLDIYQVSTRTDSIYFVLIGMFIFVLPLFVESQRIIVPKLITALLYIYSPLSMIYKFAPHVVMSNIAIEKLNNLEDKLNNAAAKTVKPSTILNDFQTIELKSLLFNYTDKDNQALFQVGPLDLTINKGEIIFIAGGNGSGKSTLLKMLTGLYETISPGEIILDGSVLTKERVPDYRELFTIIFTDYHLFNKLYGLDHIDPSLITSLLEEMELDKKTQYVNHQFTNTNLSTGQKKRLAYLAARLENKPIYVFDEWAADQDPNFRQYFYTTIIKDLKRAGKTIIAVTHDDRYFHEADRLIQMKDGKIIQ